jgi:hypothetical protein
VNEAPAQPDAKSDYEFCQKLLIENISIIERMEIYATGAIAATIVFSASTEGTSLAYVSSLVPILIALIGCLRWIGLSTTISTIGDYLAKYDETLANGGWTKYYRDNKKTWRKTSILKLSRHAIWVILLLVSVGFATITFCYGPLGNLE